MMFAFAYSHLNPLKGKMSGLELIRCCKRGEANSAFSKDVTILVVPLWILDLTSQKAIQAINQVFAFSGPVFSLGGNDHSRF
jgi:hypothetical protein